MSRSEIEGRLTSAVAARTGTAVADMDPRFSFERFGLDSVGATEIVGELGSWLGRELSETLLYDYPSIFALATHLSGANPSGALRNPRIASRLEPIAIVGLACRFPQANGPNEFWQLLASGQDAVGEPPPDRFGSMPSSQGSEALAFGAFISNVDDFDPLAFGISPNEAASMDPQQRLLLEVAFEAVEDAGLTAELAGSSTGVFVGVSTFDHAQNQFVSPNLPDRLATTGSATSIVANRLSYALDLRGPSLALDTACSSSLVALHIACGALWAGECEQALAGGVNLMLTARTTLGLARLGLLAADGRCKAFDARADGFVRGEGAGTVVLKPLAHAIEDGDRVLALLRGSAYNNDGRTNGLTAPSRTAQEEVLREAYARAEVSPSEIDYVEAQGTGTRLGDVVEANALASVLATGRPLSRLCSIGSVKTNIGHLEAAAGIAGVIKVVLALQHGVIPPSLHFSEPNPGIAFERMPIAVAAEARPWDRPAHGPRRAGVSAFGFGGTNAHVVLEEVGSH